MGKEAKLDREAIEAVLERAFVLRLGLCVDNEPYVVPLSFAYSEGAIIIHCSPKGKKMDMLRQNPRVCFEVDVDAGVLKPMDSEDGCKFAMRYASVIGFGAAHILEDHAEKVAALKTLLAHYSEREYPMPDKKVEATAVIRIDIESMTGKQAG